MKRRILNLLLDGLSGNLKLRGATVFTKWAGILAESAFCTQPEFHLNGERHLLENPPLPLRRVIDGGANCGNWSAALIETRPELRQLALIEPNEQLVSDLRERFRNDSRATIKRKALDYREDQLELSFAPGANSHATLNPTSRPPGDHLRQDVPTTTLDQLLEELAWPSIDLLKLDLEGFDHFALLGGRNTLATHKVSLIQFEVTRTWETAGCSPCSTFRLLRETGFNLFHLRPKSLQRIDPAQTPHFSTYSNFCAIHKSVTPTTQKSLH